MDCEIRSKSQVGRLDRCWKSTVTIGRSWYATEWQVVTRVQRMWQDEPDGRVGSV